MQFNQPVVSFQPTCLVKQLNATNNRVKYEITHHIYDSSLKMSAACLSDVSFSDGLNYHESIITSNDKCDLLAPVGMTSKACRQ
jgi:hypothetical protein